MVSLGTLRFSSALTAKVHRLWLGFNAAHIPPALIQGIAWQQDYLCRCLGECMYGEPLDTEIGDLVGVALPGSRWFSYVRYNQSYKTDRMEELLRNNPKLAKLDAIHAIPMLREIGQAYAREHVKLAHLI